MDFLILFSDANRVVIEIDGKHHYADGDMASPKNYATTVSEDRKLRLRGYEVYRFGGFELCTSNKDGQIIIKETAHQVVKEFFASLFDKYGVVPMHDDLI
jgi:very-short-patch-repair endonuclease